MARSIKAPDLRRTEILDAAEHLISTKGYEQMTIQDLLDHLQISKGGFYHYFDSKLALLEAILVRRKAELQQRFLLIVQDDQLSTLAKLQRFFDTLSLWKTAQKVLLLPLLQVLYGDDNAVFRQKLRTSSRATLGAGPALTELSSLSWPCSPVSLPILSAKELGPRWTVSTTSPWRSLPRFGRSSSRSCSDMSVARSHRRYKVQER